MGPFQIILSEAVAEASAGRPTFEKLSVCRRFLPESQTATVPGYF
jgi:hypothetical protein